MSNDQTENVEFNQWAILEIMGHKIYAGRVSAQMIGKDSFVRLDVPPHEGKEGFCKLWGSSAIFCITIVSEETAMAHLGANSSPMPVLHLPAQGRLAFDDGEDSPYGQEGPW